MASLNPLPRIHNHLPPIVLLRQLGISGGDKVISRSVSILTSPLWPSLLSVDTTALGARPNWQKAIHFIEISSQRYAAVDLKLKYIMYLYDVFAFT